MASPAAEEVAPVSAALSRIYARFETAAARGLEFEDFCSIVRQSAIAENTQLLIHEDLNHPAAQGEFRSHVLCQLRG